METKTTFMQVAYRNPEKVNKTSEGVPFKLQKDSFNGQPPRSDLFITPQPQQLWFCRQMFGFMACDNYQTAKEFLLDFDIEAEPRLSIVYDMDCSSSQGIPVWIFEDKFGLRTLPVFNSDRNFATIGKILHPTYVELHHGELINIYGGEYLVVKLPQLGLTLLRLRAFFHAKLAAQLAWTQYGEDMEFVLAKLYSAYGFHHYLGTYWIGCNHENDNMLYIPFLTTMQNGLDHEEDLAEIPRYGLDRGDSFRLYRTDYQVFGNPGKVNDYYALPQMLI